MNPSKHSQKRKRKTHFTHSQCAIWRRNWQLITFHLFPLERPDDYKAEDTFFMDGIHPSEVFVAIQLKQHSSKFWGQIDKKKLILRRSSAM